MLNDIVRAHAERGIRIGEYRTFNFVLWLVGESVRYEPTVRLTENGYVGTLYVVIPALEKVFDYEELLCAAPSLRTYDANQWVLYDPSTHPDEQTIGQVQQYMTRRLEAFIPNLLHAQVFDFVPQNHHTLHVALLFTDLTPAIHQQLERYSIAAESVQHFAAVDDKLRLYRRDGRVDTRALSRLAPVGDDTDFAQRVSRYYKLQTLANL